LSGHSHWNSVNTTNPIFWWDVVSSRQIATLSKPQVGHLPESVSVGVGEGLVGAGGGFSGSVPSEEQAAAFVFSKVVEPFLLRVPFDHTAVVEERRGGPAPFELGDCGEAVLDLLTLH
jgi:hypothetical protein